MRRLLCTLSLLASTLYVTGCGFTNDKILSVAPAGKGTHGRVIGGQAPVVGAVVSIYAIGVGGPPTLLASTVSDSAGNFAFGGVGTSYSCGALATKSPVKAQQAPSIHPQQSNGQKASSIGLVGGGPLGGAGASPATLPDSTETYVYITAVGGDSGGGINTSIALGAALGKCIDAQSATVEINEVSTVVLANVAANFVQNNTVQIGTSITDAHQVNALEIALTNTFQTIDDLPTGTIKPNTVATDGGTSITIEAAKIYSIANTIASCVNSADKVTPTPGPSDACTTLFAAATTNGNKSFDTFTAALYMAFSPTTDVVPLYQLAGSKPPFVGLATPPNDWSVGISYSTSAMGLEIYLTPINQDSSSTIDLDSDSRVWFPSNKSGAVGIGYFDPTENTFNGPYNDAISGHNLVLPQYVALDDVNQIAWITDLYSNNLYGVRTDVGHEGTFAYGYYFFDNNPGTSTYSLGPLFVNSDESVVLNYDDSFGTPKEYAFDPFTSTINAASTFTLQPTGMTVNTTQGSDSNDPAFPGVVAATSDDATTCNVEFSAQKGPMLTLINETPSGGCHSGGIATTQYHSANGVQDQVAAFGATDEYCSEIRETCTGLPEYLNDPEGVAVDGGNEVWFANRGNGSIFQLLGTYDDGGTPLYSQVGTSALLHGAGNGDTMTRPVGMAVDRSGNIWVSNTNCTGTSDTTCVYTLSEVFATGFPTFTPLSLQAARLQGTQPPQGLTEASGTPKPMLRGKPLAYGSILK